jgi:hypothetical protein
MVRVSGVGIIEADLKARVVRQQRAVTAAHLAARIDQHHAAGQHVLHGLAARIAVSDGGRVGDLAGFLSVARERSERKQTRAQSRQCSQFKAVAKHGLAHFLLK